MYFTFRNIGTHNITYSLTIDNLWYVVKVTIVIVLLFKMLIVLVK
jgi:hypothetical protein